MGATMLRGRAATPEGRTRASADRAGLLVQPSRLRPTLPLLQATLSSSLLSRLHPVPQTPSTVVAMEVARVQPLPLLTATSNFLDRSLKPTTPTSREQLQTTRIASMTFPPSTRSPPSPAPTPSRTTTAASSLAARTTRTSNSTTPSSSLDTAPTSAPLALWTTGLSGTAGENPGERMATSGSFERQTHSVAWTQQLLDMSARTVLAFPTPSTCVACAGCSLRPPSLSELISSDHRFW